MEIVCAQICSSDDLDGFQGEAQAEDVDVDISAHRDGNSDLPDLRPFRRVLKFLDEDLSRLKVAQMAEQVVGLRVLQVIPQKPIIGMGIGIPLVIHDHAIINFVFPSLSLEDY